MDLASLLAETASAVRQRLDNQADWGPTGAKQGQYQADLAANDAALEVLLDAGVGVLSEETGLHHPDRELIVVLDPVDGSTNAASGIPWFCVSLCAVGRNGILAAHVEDLTSGTAFTAKTGEGACLSRRVYAKTGRQATHQQEEPQPIKPSKVAHLPDALLGVSGYPTAHWGWKQYRSLGSAALDLCLVASGCLDAFADVSPGELAPWDYLGGIFVCQQAGACVTDLNGDDLLVLDDTARRRPAAAGTPELLDSLCTKIR